ncbi:MAG: 2-polyprenyl-6-methoxyphenol hydroxylase-like FAD-dependent oxidoreductase, partial [Gammaproteobacteria bacterium]
MKAIIAGAGIGGLTAALSLNKIGVEVKVFESVSEIRPLGVGINILPHASRELIALGLQSELDKFAIRTRSMQYFTRRGKLVLSVPCGEYAGYNWPQYSLHRGEFQMLLLNTFKKRAGEDSVVTGCQLADF